MTEQSENEDRVQRPKPLTDFYGEDRHELVQKLAYQHRADRMPGCGLEFHVQEGTAAEWWKIVDTALPSPNDFADRGVPLEQTKCTVAPRSIVVLGRPKKSDARQRL
jgi:hypothetical protein